MISKTLFLAFTTFIASSQVIGCEETLEHNYGTAKIKSNNQGNTIMSNTSRLPEGGAISTDTFFPTNGNMPSNNTSVSQFGEGQAPIVFSSSSSQVT